MSDETVDASVYRDLRATGPASGRPCLLVYRDDGTETVDLPDGSHEIGREGGLAVVVDDKRVSRRHVRLDVRGGKVSVVDLRSRNGTVVAGARLEPGQAAPLRPGDTLLVGGAIAAVLARRAPDERPALAADADGVALDPAMGEVVALIHRVAPTPLPVLILGETGVGKEVVAQAIHARSARARAPFVALNCAALPEQLLESELFGHERGAFTGATATKPGLVETADGGTILLDEIGEMALALQAKLLRFLEDRSFQRVGGTARKTVDVRLLAATNRDLHDRVARGAFREDLLFRLNAVTLTVPPLRERPAELAPLAAHFARQIARQLGRAVPSLAPAALAALRRHRWPGNIRELRNVVERAVVLCDGPTITPAQLPERLRGDAAAADGDEAGGIRDELRQLERHRIVEALGACGWNQTRAAEKLGMPRRTLVHKIRQYNLRRPE